ncbi:hypothetical protein AB0I39_06325 [Kitasatospora purpeofusca]|uniref:hypothetical protein n=1 Tax=Kitasatospora purpeofusca TaxID=67352 RepID=UPI0033C74134
MACTVERIRAGVADPVREDSADAPAGRRRTGGAGPAFLRFAGGPVAGTRVELLGAS